MQQIWVIDDDASSRELLARVLGQRGWAVEQLADGREALERLAAGKAPDLVVSDIRMGEVDGLAVTEAFRRDAPDTPVILVTAFGNVDGAVEAIRRGAFDYVSKPYDVDAVQLTAARALEQRRLASENRALRRQLRDKYRLENAVGRSEAMLQVFKTAARVAASDATVLILGESGTGKELVARALHQASPRGAFTGAQLALSVSDTGAGIGAEERRHIFEPFYSTKPPGRGTGLGLAICREIAVALKGRIEVDSEPGRGSTFTFLVPAQAWRAAG